MIHIEVCFSRAKSCLSVFSKGIQFIEKRRYGHVFIKYTDSLTGVVMVAQASRGFVNEMSYDNFLKDNVVVKSYSLLCNEENFLKIMTFIKKNLGTPYGKSQIFFILLKKILKVEIKSYNKEKYFICSEFGAYICSILGITTPSSKDYLTPSDLDSILIKAGLYAKMV